MSDDKSKQGYQDDSKIAEDELSYWCKKWDVSPDTIRDAIDCTGSHAVSKIEAHLKLTGAIPE